MLSQSAWHLKWLCLRSILENRVSSCINSRVFLFFLHRFLFPYFVLTFFSGWTQLCQHLPARAEGYTWSLLYSTSKHGFSLKSLYREMAKIDSPILMVIQDTKGSVFGALTSCPIKTSDLFYGTGESFLFTFDPDFARFPWTGDNMYFIKGNSDSLVIGAGDGMFGLWLDEDICHGRSQPCNTFANPRLSKEEDFVVKALECWAFVWGWTTVPFPVELFPNSFILSRNALSRPWWLKGICRQSNDGHLFINRTSSIYP